MPRKNKLLLILMILAIGVWFRFSWITEIPPGLYPDEAANGNNALEALRTGVFRAFYPENNGREGLFINLQAIAIKLMGAEPWALRVVSAVFGTLTILGIYLLAKELFRGSESKIMNHESRNAGDHDSKFKIHDSILIALLSAFFLATSYWHINFSRLGFRAIMVPLFATFAMYWLLKALSTGKMSSAVLGGLAAGLGFHTYIAFRFMPFVFVVPILFSLYQWRKNQERHPAYPVSDHREARRHGPPTAVGGATPSAERNSSAGWNGRVANGVAGRRTHCIPCVITLFIFVAFIVALPIGLYFLQHPQDFFGRGGQVSIFSAESPLREFIKSNILTFGMFHVRGDCNQRHNLNCEPQLFWPVGIFFIIGLMITIHDLFKKPLSPVPYTLLAWFLFMMSPATLTREGLPHALRAIGMIPPVMILAAIGGAKLVQEISGYFSRALENPDYQRFRTQLHRIQKELLIAALLLLVWIAFTTERNYFVRFAYSEHTPDAFAADLWHQGQYFRALPQETRKFSVVNLSGDDIRGVPAPAQTIMFATDTFGEAEQSMKHMRYVRSLDEIHIDPGERIAIIPMNPRARDLISAIRKQFPEFKVKVPGDFMVFEN